MKSNNDNMRTLILLSKYYIHVNKKSILLALISIYCTCIMFGIILGAYNIGGGMNQSMFSYFVLMFIGWVVTASAFSDMKTKEDRISSIMLPANTWHKFVIKWFTMVILLTGVLILGFYVIDLSRIGSNILIYGQKGDNIAYYKMINPFAYISRSVMNLGFGIPASVLTGYFFNQAFFFFGSILWPKKSFVKTLAALWMLQFIITGILLIFNKSIHLQQDAFGIYMEWVFYIEIIVCVAFYYFSYLRLKRSQVIYKLF